MISASEARMQLGTLLERLKRKKGRFVITKSGKPAAVLLSVTDFDDMAEELDPQFQRSLQIAAAEHRAGKSIPLQNYLKEKGRTK